MARGSTSKYEKLRILVTKDTITLEIQDSRKTSFTTSLRYFATVLDRLIEKVSEGALLSAELLEGATKEPEISTQVKCVSTVKPRRAYAKSKSLRVYIPAKVSKWLDITHGSPLSLECIRIRGKKAILLKPLRGGQE